MSDAASLHQQLLLDHARRARDHAYAPYSNFRVGAVLVCSDGREFSGCNVENAAYGLCNCAERTALFSAIASGYKPGDFATLVVIGDTPGPIAPCGACRQVMAELCDKRMPVVLANLHEASFSTTVEALLPGSFSRSDMANA